MPGGMLLKSDGFASNLSTPEPGQTFGDYCRAHGIAYHDTDLPVRLEDFIAYGMSFQQRNVPCLEHRDVTHITTGDRGYRLELDDGEVLEAARVVMAVGISHFDQMPVELAALNSTRISHSSAHSDVAGFRGQDVAVLGAGSSAVDLAIHLHEAGARVRLISRAKQIKFSGTGLSRPRSLWDKIRHPKSGLGPGLRARLCTDAPDIFRHLPAQSRLDIVSSFLGPSSPGYLREKLEGKVDLLLGSDLEECRDSGEGLHLKLCRSGARGDELKVDHLICATGYRADLDRLGYVAPSLREQLARVGAMPALTSGFQSSARGLFFVGNAAAGSFGPLMRFIFGADFAARRISRQLARASG